MSNRAQRRADKKKKGNGKISMTPGQLNRVRESAYRERDIYKTEAMLVCFALYLRREKKYGHKRLMKALNGIDELMGPIIDGTQTIEDYRDILENEVGIVITTGGES